VRPRGSSGFDDRSYQHTPLNYLVLIDAVRVLPGLFGRVLVPEAVMVELGHPKAPERVRSWSANPPSWLEVLAVTLPADPALSVLEAGERDAILLVEQVGADLLLVDERAASGEAKHRGLSTMGTLGVLETAAVNGLIDFSEELGRLRQTSFHVSSEVLAPFLERDSQRREPTEPES